MDFNDFKDLLKEQIRILKQFLQDSDELRKTIIAKDFQNMEKVIQKMNHHSETMEMLEKLRTASFHGMCDALNLPKDISFAEFLRMIPDEELSQNEKRSVLGFYRELKLISERIKVINSQISIYVESLSSAFKDILDEILPSRKSKTYSKKGKVKHAHQNPLVLNTHC